MSGLFVQAFNAISSTFLVNGENGMPEFTTTSSNLLDLFTKLIRDLPDNELNRLVAKCFSDINKGDFKQLVDLFVLTFQTRDCRGGKGEKSLFIKLIFILYNEYPDTVILLLSEIPQFGYYKDLLNIHLLADKRLQRAIIELFATQLLEDHSKLLSSRRDGSVPELRFIAKYAPREGKPQFKVFYNQLVSKLFGKSRTSKIQYRKIIVELTAALQVPEVLMCANRFQDIYFKNVPSLCLNRFRKAFLNELVVKKGKHSDPLTRSEEETGNRHPYDPNRVLCRQNLKTSALTGKLNSKVLLPHELISKLMTPTKLSSIDSSVFDAQWIKIREDVIDGIAKLNNLPDPNSINLGKLVPLVDVSGSMDGIPMEVAIALGILVSEVSDPAFKDHFITFESRPTWVSLQGITSIYDKVQKTKNAPWGGSTDFNAALEMILKVVVDKKLSPDDIPDLIVFSDMQFNSAGRFNETMHDVIKRKFAKAGFDICGKPYPTPKIIYWNLRADTKGFPVQANTPNTQILSGFSPSILKLILNGDPLVQEQINPDGSITNSDITPLQTFRNALDDHRYDPIRLILSSSDERILSSFHFT